jgi:LysR family transcriptional regulator, transcriptional activator of nhaA
VTVGIADVVPKVVAERFLAPALQLPERVLLVCREGNPARLIAELALHELDLVLSDAPSGAEVKVRAFNHPLGTSAITFFARPDLARRARSRFPACLEEIPLLLPTETTAMRRRLEQWFAKVGLRPTVAAEFDDAALLGAFGLRGVGAFPAATVTAREVERQSGVRAIGEVDEVRESYFAITVERRIKHPAVIAICEGARALLGEGQVQAG